eukprot:Skav233722  [mRNA]  locus=scaffold2120:393902:395627:+ [translate_table: standard]
MAKNGDEDLQPEDPESTAHGTATGDDTGAPLADAQEIRSAAQPVMAPPWQRLVLRALPPVACCTKEDGVDWLNQSLREEDEEEEEEQEKNKALEAAAAPI